MRRSCVGEGRGVPGCMHRGCFRMLASSAIQVPLTQKRSERNSTSGAQHHAAATGIQQACRMQTGSPSATTVAVMCRQVPKKNSSRHRMRMALKQGICHVRPIWAASLKTYDATSSARPAAQQMGPL